ncbi:hypothetical protein B0H10DRAFT_2207515 [Mycena sp. CBHHK59/15]|nr:hypothetical protein B0H10DRAFT_2207515 [Mycena sp. CBHHK59/15]
MLVAIFRLKIQAACQDENPNLQFSWELVQKSVLDSVLDFIDQKPTKSNKTAAATALYPTICNMYYPQTGLFEWKSPTLMANVNMLLSETATDHPENQSQLRNDKILGPKRMGTALSQTKDYFTIESLLLLVGVLLPARQTAAKRTQFINELFTADLFERSDDIKKLIDESTTEWDPVVMRIINEPLAESDLSFPQPFYISNLQTFGPQPNVTQPLYIDNKGFYANTEQPDGTIDSYQAPFITVERIKLSSPASFSTSVMIRLTAEPFIGAASDANHLKKSAMGFAIKKEDVQRFLKSLRGRGLGKLINEADRKVSKITEGLSLEFDSHGQKPPTQQEKVAKVEQLWHDNADRGLGEPTSPLMAQSSVKEPESSHHVSEASSVHDAIFGDDLSEVSDCESKIPATRHVTPKAPPAAAKPSADPDSPVVASSRSRVRIVLDSDSEEDMARAQPSRKAVPRKSAMKMKAVTQTEDDIEDSQSPPSSNVRDQDFEPTQDAPVVDRPARVTRGAVAKKKTLVPLGELPKTVPGCPKPSPVARTSARSSPARPTRRPAPKFVLSDEDVSEDEDNTTRKLAASAKPSSETSPRGRSTSKLPSGKDDASKTEIASKKPDTKSGRKRAKTDGDASLEEDMSDSDRRPRKRVRGTTDAAPDKPAIAPRRDSAAVFDTRTVNPAPATKRYGKKGRTSSPAPFAVAGTDMAVDYDELPASPSPVPPLAPPAPTKVGKTSKQEASVGDTRLSRVAAMRGKAGKPTVKPEPVVKAPSKSNKTVPSERTKAKTQPRTAKSEKTMIAEEIAEVVSDDESKPSRRSTRGGVVSKAADPILTVIASKPKAKPVKPKKAPWEDMDLNKNNVATSDEPVPAPAVFEEDHVDAKVAQEKSKPVVSEPKANLEKPQSVAGHDVDLAKDDVTTSDEPDREPAVFEEFYVPLKAKDVTMIDLTQDATPKVKKLEPQVLQISVHIESELLKDDTASPIRQQTRPASPIPVAMTRFAAKTTARPTQPQPVSLLSEVSDPYPLRPARTSTPTKLSTPVRPKKLPTLRPPSPQVDQTVLYAPSRLSPVPPVPRRTEFSNRSSSPVQPDRVHHKVTFTPSRASPPPSRRRHAKDQFVLSRQTADNITYERSPDFGRPTRPNFSRGQHKSEVDENIGRREYEHKRSDSPMQGILEILNEIQEVVVDKISRRFEHVRHDVRVGRDNILRGAAANLETMCAQSEGHFNTLVDLEEEYATYHRKVTLGVEEMQRSSELMSNALGQIIQHHDRRTLSKKLPTTLFTLPSVLRNPALSI